MAACDTRLSWLDIIRLGLVQTSLGAIIVLTNSALNRVMVVELALPAFVPGLLVAVHYALQVLRPRWGHGSDMGGRRTPWIMGGMAVLAMGGALSSVGVALMASHLLAGLVLATLAFVLIGVGVGAAGTSLLVLLAERAGEARRAAAATTVWLMMIAGFVITTVVAGKLLDPFSFDRLVAVMSGVSALAFCVSMVAVSGVERGHRPAPKPAEAKVPFTKALREVLAEPESRRFSIFIFVSMLAYSAQDLILEPYAGAVFGMTPGQSTGLGGMQHGGVFVGMILVPVIGKFIGGSGQAALRRWTVFGCVASGFALVAIAVGGSVGAGFPLKEAVFALGLANGIYAVAAIGSMMGLAVDAEGGRDGTRMGLWGAAQAVSMGLGGLTGAAAVDVARLFAPTTASAYMAVFLLEALVFLLSALLAARVHGTMTRTARQSLAPLRTGALAAGE
jgi:MFS transporter, BCD family, chlorophyll transporter